MIVQELKHRKSVAWRRWLVAHPGTICRCTMSSSKPGTRSIAANHTPTKTSTIHSNSGINFFFSWNFCYAMPFLLLLLAVPCTAWLGCELCESWSVAGCEVELWWWLNQSLLEGCRLKMEGWRLEKRIEENDCKFSPKQNVKESTYIQFRVC